LKPVNVSGGTTGPCVIGVGIDELTGAAAAAVASASTDDSMFV